MPDFEKQILFPKEDIYNTLCCIPFAVYYCVAGHAKWALIIAAIWAAFFLLMHLLCVARERTGKRWLGVAHRVARKGFAVLVAFSLLLFPPKAMIGSFMARFPRISEALGFFLMRGGSAILTFPFILFQAYVEIDKRREVRWLEERYREEQGEAFHREREGQKGQQNADTL